MELHKATTKARGSLVWKAIVHSFYIIGKDLAWNPRNGNSVILGSDAIVKLQEDHLPPNLITDLNSINLGLLLDVSDAEAQENLSLGWNSANSLDLTR